MHPTLFKRSQNSDMNNIDLHQVYNQIKHTNQWWVLHLNLL